MGNCDRGDHIAGNHIQTDITRCDIEDPQQKYRLGTISNRLLGGLTCFTGQNIALCFCSGSKLLVRMMVSLLIDESTWGTNKSRIRPMMNQR